MNGEDEKKQMDEKGMKKRNGRRMDEKGRRGMEEQ